MSLSSFFTNTKNFIEAEFEKLFGVGTKLVQQLLPFLKSQTAAVAADLMPDALAIVQALAADPTKTGVEKQASAAKQLAAKATADGWTVANATINFVIEAALQTFLATAKPTA